MQRSIVCVVAALVSVSSLVSGTSGLLAQSGGKVIPLRGADRENLEKHLGRGVVGKAVTAGAIEDVAKLLGLDKNEEVTGRVVSGDDKGKAVRVDLHSIARNEGRPAWKRTVGSKTVQYGELMEDGSVVTYAIVDNDEGVVTRYSPHEPAVMKGMEPGATRKMRINVEVSNLTSPEKVSHSGYLDLVYEYVGAYEVTVPLGKFDAVLFKWDYKGKIGPASVEDHEYIFVAPGIGEVASVYRTDVSAFLVYQSHEKAATVAVSRKELN